MCFLGTNMEIVRVIYILIIRLFSLKLDHFERATFRFGPPKAENKYEGKNSIKITILKIVRCQILF